MKLAFRSLALAAVASLPLLHCGSQGQPVTEHVALTKLGYCGCGPYAPMPIPINLTQDCFTCLFESRCDQMAADACKSSCGPLTCGVPSTPCTTSCNHVQCATSCNRLLTNSGLPCPGSPSSVVSALDGLQDCAAERCNQSCGLLTVDGPLDPEECTPCLQMSCAAELQACQAQ